MQEFIFVFCSLECFFEKFESKSSAQKRSRKNCKPGKTCCCNTSDCTSSQCPNKTHKSTSKHCANSKNSNHSKYWPNHLSSIELSVCLAFFYLFFSVFNFLFCLFFLWEPLLHNVFAICIFNLFRRSHFFATAINTPKRT